MQPTLTAELGPLHARVVQQGLDPVQERLVAPPAQLDNTGQVLGQDAVTVPKTIIAQEQDQLLVHGVLLEKFLLLDPQMKVIATMLHAWLVTT